MSKRTSEYADVIDLHSRRRCSSKPADSTPSASR